MVDAISFTGHFVLWCDKRIVQNPDLAPAPAGFEFLSPARSGSSRIWTSQIQYHPTINALCCGRVYSIRVPSAGTDAGDACRGCCLASVPGTVSTSPTASVVVTRRQYSAIGSTSSSLHQPRCSSDWDRQTGKFSSPLCFYQQPLSEWLTLCFLYIVFFCLCIYFFA